VLSENEVRAVLAPYEGRLSSCFYDAWTHYLADHALLRHRYSARSQSSLLRDYIVYEVREQFDGVPRTQVLSVRGLEVLDICGLVVIRFKKLDNRKHAAPSATQQAFQFIHQLEIPELPPATTKLQAGYQLNELRTAFTAVWVVCPNGREVPHYAWRLAGPTAIELPVATVQEADATPLVRPKTGLGVRRVDDDTTS
jgi:hypothetical protein